MTPLGRPLFIGHEIYRHSSYGGWHPLRIPRVSTVMDLSRALGWLPRAAYVTSPRAKPAAIAAFHTPDYIAALQEAERTGEVSAAVRARHNIGTHANPVFPEMYRRPATSAGAALLAGELLAGGGVVYAPACGTHHALADAASGFCYFNDPVLAILSLRRQGLRRIAYVDIDAHHGDGVEIAFRDEPEVLVLSVHEENRWPRTGALGDRGAGNVWNLPVPRGFHDDEMALARDAVILPAVQAHRPEAIVLQCGADGVTEDPQSRMELSNNAHWAVAAALMPLAPRMLGLGGGGYNPWSVGRLWTGIWGTLSGQEVPERLPAQAEAVLRALRWEGRTRVTVPPESWVTTLRDPLRGGSIRSEVRDRISALRSRLTAEA
ncbi:acetoin utilization protein AcuC [Wenxinia saemankumensis]|uniref:Acetoin utilization protein AcuC n=1 Tax=Wenxinia saemankumensis TaxID=1447782 RepID=A0A1M6CQA3_9RHOB|nr:acetoin utilization protein AcuC [Wenxinia saemankumensis]SHI63063.1 acetoin utilization protein AcuC [Wenxinia saemankumensis]